MPVIFELKPNTRHAAKQRRGFLRFLASCVNSKFIYSTLKSRGVLAEVLPQLRLHTKKTGGFTLLEMLVVIALLAALATISLSAFDSTVDDSVVLMTQTEMVEISKALRNFKRDNGVYPRQGKYACNQLVTYADKFEVDSGGQKMVLYSPSANTAASDWIDWCESPANFWMLLNNPMVNFDGSSPDNEWNVNIARGWRGPYLSKQGGGLVKVCNTLLDDGTGSPIGCASADVIEVNSMADAFEHTFADNGNTMVWRACTEAGNTVCNDREKWGRPYLLFDMNNVNARVVSMGPDGHYDGVNATYPCSPNNDDLVLCLK